MFNIAFIVQAINTPINFLKDSIEEEYRQIEDSIYSLPDKDQIGYIISKEQYDSQIDSIKNKIETISQLSDNIDQISQTINSVSEIMQTLSILSLTLQTLAKVSVAAVPGGIAVLAAQEIKDFGKLMQEQSSSAAGSLKNKSSDLTQTLKEIKNKKNKLEQRLQNI